MCVWLGIEKKNLYGFCEIINHGEKILKALQGRCKKESQPLRWIISNELVNEELSEKAKQDCLAKW